MFATVMRLMVKKTTGITGLPVIPEGRKILIALYEKTLEDIKTIPEDVFYRTAVETQTKKMLQVCRDHEDIETIELKFSPFQIEEMIVRAEDELELIPMMREWKPWDVPAGTQIPVVFEDDEDSPIFKELEHLIPAVPPVVQDNQ